MTEQEAIKWLKTFKGRYRLAELEESVDMAIQALGQTQPTQTCVKPTQEHIENTLDCVGDRAVSLNAVIELIESWWLGHTEEDDIVEILKQMPSVQPQIASDCVGRKYIVHEVERTHGHWIYIDDDNLKYDSFMCSECHKSITVDAKRTDDIGFVIDDMKFCPNCGARMGGE